MLRQCIADGVEHIHLNPLARNQSCSEFDSREALLIEVRETRFRSQSLRPGCRRLPNPITPRNLRQRCSTNGVRHANLPGSNSNCDGSHIFHYERRGSDKWRGRLCDNDGWQRHASVHCSRSAFRPPPPSLCRIRSSTIPERPPWKIPHPARCWQPEPSRITWSTSRRHYRPPRSCTARLTRKAGPQQTSPQFCDHPMLSQARSFPNNPRTTPSIPTTDRHGQSRATPRCSH